MSTDFLQGGLLYRNGLYDMGTQKVRKDISQRRTIQKLTLPGRYQGEIQTSEEFSTAGRTVKSGLVAAAVVSSWTWAATLLQ